MQLFVQEFGPKPSEVSGKMSMSLAQANPLICLSLLVPSAARANDMDIFLCQEPSSFPHWDFFFLIFLPGSTAEEHMVPSTPGRETERFRVTYLVCY